MPESVIHFSRLRGHEGPRRLLCSAASNDRLAHALLFAGPDGIGKAAWAMAFAAWVQCESRGEEACGECRSCRQIAAGSHPDVKKIGIPEKKKEIGVDQAREVKRFTQLRPVGGRYKVVVVENAHTLNTAAQNALLKTLEDPPSQSILILVASSADALLATVRSRCQRVNFQPLTEEDVRNVLVSGHQLDPDLAARLAAAAEGSPGRALALRKHLGDDANAYTNAVSGLEGRRYVELMSVAETLAQPEAAMLAKLEIVLSQAAGAAAEALRSGDRATADRWLRRAQVLGATANALRHRNPNRQLLIDSLMLRLARC